MIEFSFTGEKAKYFKTIIDVVQNIVTGPRKFDFYPDKLVMASMEGSSSVFVMFEIKKEFFNTFSVEEASLGLSIDDLKKIFSRSIKDQDLISFKYSESDNRMIVMFKGERSKSEYKINVHITDDQEQDLVGKVKAIPLGTEINFEGGHLKNILSDVGVVAQKDFKQLEVRVPSTQQISFELKADTTGINAKSEFSVGEGSPIQSINMEDDEEVVSYYDMEYLERLFKIDSIAGETKVELTSNHPLRLTFKIKGDTIEFVYLMAPLELEEDL